MTKRMHPNRSGSAVVTAQNSSGHCHPERAKRRGISRAAADIVILERRATKRRISKKNVEDIVIPNEHEGSQKTH